MGFAPAPGVHASDSTQRTAAVIHHHIDLGTVLRGTVCNLYSNLVTRPTGAAVRSEIERAIAESGGRMVTVIDFSQVMLLDFSCADEIVAKLMLRYCAPATEGEGTSEGYFVFHGLGEHHLDAVEQVLERHRLAIVAVLDGTPTLVGDVADVDRGVWERLRDLGPSDVATLARGLGEPPSAVAACLDGLCARRLAMRVGATYAVLGAFGPPAPEAAA
jgi:hypothetical protein